MRKLTGRSTRTSLRRATLCALGPLMTAGLLATIPSAASAEGGDPLSPENTQSVDVSGVDTDPAPGDAPGIGTAPLPKPDWPQAGVTTEINLSDDFVAGDQEVDARTENPAEAPEVLTIETLGKLPTSNPFGPGAAFTIVPTSETPEPDAGTEPTEPTEPTQPTDPDAATDPVDPTIDGALFRPTAISALWAATTPTPDPTPTPETSPTPTPEPSETPQVPDPGEETPAEPGPDEPYTAPIEVQLNYGDFAGAYGGNWANRLRAVLMEDCTTVEEQLTCAKSTPLESTNNTETKTVTAVIPASVYSDGSDDDTNVGPASVGPSSMNTDARQAITATPTATTSSTTVALVAGASGDQGDFSASPLNANSQWSSGGQSGDFTWSYPLTVPPGANGPTPDLSIGYSSGSVDGRTSASNNQTSVIGEGFDLNPGFIERSYSPCQDDVDAGHPGNAPDDVGDLCYRDDNVTMSLGGKSNQLIQADDGSWRMKSDDGTRILRKVGGMSQNDDNEGEYWIVITPDGTQYYFGKNKRFAGDTNPTDSVATVRVFGNQTGEPCHTPDNFHESSCKQAWRWGLDYVVDPNGNSMSLFYNRETNYYDTENNGGTPSQYDSAIRLTQIEYGTREGTENDGPAPARVTFSYTARCVDAGTDCDNLTEDTAHSWPDVPFDRYCTTFSPDCAGRTSPSFFSLYRMNEIHTSILDAGGYSTVNSWDLTQIFPSTGDSTDRALWLRSIKQTGYNGTSQIALPTVSFSAEQMANRVDEGGDGREPFNKIRVRAIRNGLGGATTIDYSNRECTPDNRPVGSNLDNNIMRCFPVYVARETQPGHEIEFFHKYVVNSVVESDLTGGAPSVPTTYEYVGNPAWRKDMSNLTRGVYRTWSDWRGYLRVRTTVGKTNPTWNETLYLRGMHGNPKQDGTTATYVVTDTDSPNVTDLNPYVGFVRRTTTKLGPGGPTLSTTYNDPAYEKTADAGGDDTASIVNTIATQRTTPLSTGGNRVTRTETEYDTRGRPIKAKDLGDMSISSDDQCTKTNYAENPSATVWIMNTVAESTTTAGSGCSAPQAQSDVISSTRNYYDDLALDAAPTRGRLTRVETADGFSDEISYQTDASNTYDNNGRVIKTIDAMENETQTAYTPYTRNNITYGVPTQVSTTDALGQVSVQKLNRRWGTADQKLDIAGRPTDYAFDALGRVTSIWVPGRAKATGADPSYKFAYSLSATAPNVVTSEVLGTGTDYVKSTAFFDGLLRSRETQTLAANPDGGRMITEKRYDSQGQVESERGPYYNEKAVGNDIVEAAATELPAYTNTRYDGAGRPISSTLMAFGKKKWETKTSYGGDRVSVTPPTGGTATTTISDARGRTTSLLQYRGPTPSGAADTTTYTYTDAGQLKTVATPQDDGKANKSTWSYEYDIRGRQIDADDPDKGHTHTGYDALGRVTSTTDANNKTLRTIYDKLGRKTELRDNDVLNPENGRLRASWTYLTSGNGIGQLGTSTRIEPNGDQYSTEYTYDPVGRPQDVTVKVPESVGTLLDRDYRTQISYYPNGQLKTVDQPSTTGTGVTDENLNYTYDRLGNLNTLTGAGAIVAGTTYTPDGLVTQRALGPTVGKAIYDTRDYNNTTRQLTRQAVSLQTSASTTEMDLRYAYDPAGNVTRVNDIASGDTTGSSAASFKQCFDYDYLRRMTQAWTTSSTDCTQPTTANLGTQDPYWDKYTYTNSGNRATWIQVRGTGANARTTTHTSAYPNPSESLNQPHAPTSVVSTGSDAGTESFTYDDVGNTATREGAASGNQTITWDEEGHQKSVKNTTTDKTTNYVYDAEGNRILKKDQGDNSTTLYIGNSEYTEKDNTLSLTRNYSAGDEPVVTRTKAADRLTIVVADRNKSGQLAIDGATLSVKKRRFTPFGEDLTEPAVAWPNKHGYLDKTKDTSTGTSHLGAREYDPKLGRFLSIDPVMDTADPQHMNGYAYANNSPVTSSDPSGLYANNGEWQQSPTHYTRTNENGYHEDGADSYVMPNGDSWYVPPPGPSGGWNDALAGAVSRAAGAANSLTPGFRIPDGVYAAITNKLLSADPESDYYVWGGDMFDMSSVLVSLGFGAGVSTGRAALIAETAAADSARAATLAARAEMAGIDLSAYSGGKTTGVLVGADGSKTNLISGVNGPANALSKPRPGMNGRIVSHVEAHAAAVMRQAGKTDATLYINRMPCPGTSGCMANLPRMVPRGSTLTIHVMSEGSRGPYATFVIHGKGPL